MLNTLIEILYYFLFFFTPFVMTSATSELFEFNKMLFIYLIAIFVSFFWITKMVLARKIIIKKTILNVPIAVFFGSQLLATLFSIDRHTSFFGYYGRFNGGLLSFIAYFVLFYAFISNIKKEKIFYFLNWSLFSSFLVILWALPGKFGHDLTCLAFTNKFDNNCWTNQFKPAERIFSTLGQPNWMGAYLSILFFVALFFFLSKKKSIKNSLTYGGYLILNFIAILFTRSRSALLSVVFGMIAFGVWLLLRKKSLLKKYFVLVFSVILMIAIVKTGIPKIDRYFTFHKNSKITSIKENLPTNSKLKSTVTDSLRIREIVWQGALKLGKKYPIFGTGPDTFAYAYYFVRPQTHNLTSEWDYIYNKAHNEFLNYLATSGYVGFFTYLFFLGGVFYLFFLSYQKNEKKRLFLSALFISYFSILITNFFGFSTTVINIYFYSIPAILTVLSTKEEASAKYKKATLFQEVAIFLFFLSAAYLTVGVFKYWYADTLYNKAKQYNFSNQYDKSAQLLSRALKIRKEHVYQDKFSSVLSKLSFIYSYKKEMDTSNKLKYLSLQYNQAALKQSPKNLLYWKTQAKNYLLFYQISSDKEDIEKGLLALDQAQMLAPTDPKILYYQSDFYSLLLDEEKDSKKKSIFRKKSLEKIDKAIEEKPNYEEAYYFKGMLLKKYGEKREAKKIFKFILNKIDPQSQQAQKALREL